MGDVADLVRQHAGQFVRRLRRWRSARRRRKRGRRAAPRRWARRGAPRRHAAGTAAPRPLRAGRPACRARRGRPLRSARCRRRKPRRDAGYRARRGCSWSIASPSLRSTASGTSGMSRLASAGRPKIAVTNSDAAGGETQSHDLAPQPALRRAAAVERLGAILDRRASAGVADFEPRQQRFAAAAEAQHAFGRRHAGADRHRPIRRARDPGPDCGTTKMRKPSAPASTTTSWRALHVPSK